MAIELNSAAAAAAAAAADQSVSDCSAFSSRDTPQKPSLQRITHGN